MLAFLLVIVVSPLSSIVKDQVGFLQTLALKLHSLGKVILLREISKLSFYMEVQNQ